MRIVAIEERTVPIGAAVGNAVISLEEMTTSAVAVVTDARRDGRPVIGYGIAAFGRYGQGGLLRERFIPRLLNTDPDQLLDDTGTLDPARAWAAMMRNEKPGGHGERCVAVGAVDMALWDIAAKLADRPLYRHLATTHGDGSWDEAPKVYVGGGYYYPDRDEDRLADEMRARLDEGFTDVKIKVGGVPVDRDVRRIEACLKVVPGGEHLSVDASARFDLEGGIALGRAIARFGLRWFEDVCDPLDFETQRGVAEAYAPPIATGESLFSVADQRNLLRYGGLRPDRDYLLLDFPHAYGLVEGLRSIAMVESHGWARRRIWPHGGHLFSLHLAAGLRLGGTETHAGIFAPFAGFADDIPIEAGTVRPPELPGIGWESKAGAWAVLRELASDHLPRSAAPAPGRHGVTAAPPR